MLIRTKLFRTKNIKHLARGHADNSNLIIIGKPFLFSKLILMHKVSQCHIHISSIDHKKLTMLPQILLPVHGY